MVSCHNLCKTGLCQHHQAHDVLVIYGCPRSLEVVTLHGTSLQDGNAQGEADSMPVNIAQALLARIRFRQLFQAGLERVQKKGKQDLQAASKHFGAAISLLETIRLQHKVAQLGFYCLSLNYSCLREYRFNVCDEAHKTWLWELWV